MTLLTTQVLRLRNTSVILSSQTSDSLEVMKTNNRRFRRTHSMFAIATLIALGALACGWTETAATATATVGATEAAQAAATDGATSYDFPTGDAVLVPVGYQHPGDHVDNTGAFLPANGKPTMVFVDAIW